MISPDTTIAPSMEKIFLAIILATDPHHVALTKVQTFLIVDIIIPPHNGIGSE